MQSRIELVDEMTSQLEDMKRPNVISPSQIQNVHQGTGYDSTTSTIINHSQEFWGLQCQPTNNFDMPAVT